MPETDASLPIVVCNTGPLISALQSDSLDLMTALFGVVHTSEACVAELIRHGWGQALIRAGSSIVQHSLTLSEAELAISIARQIAAQPVSKDREPNSHLGEAEVMVLAQRADLAGAVLLLDEQAARAVAMQADLTISGFPGVLLLAAEAGLLTADEVRERLEKCRRQGTHYSARLIDRVHQTAKEGEV